MITTDDMLKSGFEVLAIATDGGTHTFKNKDDIIITVNATNPLTPNDPNIKIKVLSDEFKKLKNKKNLAKIVIFDTIFEGECRTGYELELRLINIYHTIHMKKYDQK